MTAPLSASLIDSIGWTLLHFLWQGALIGCATALALTAMRNARPQQRYLVACIGLLACLLWPSAELLLRLRSGAMAEPLLIKFTVKAAAGAGADQDLAGWLQSQLLWIVAFWALCAAALSLRMAAGLLWIRRAARAQGIDPAWQARLTRMANQFGVTRTVRLRVVHDLDSPLTAGWWRPVVLVPASLMTGMPPDLLEALLAHEMGHVRRFDYLVNLGQNVIEILLFYHPAVWWLSSRIRSERELVADDLAARHLGEPRRLARALSELEKLQFSTHHLAMAANGGDLLARVRRLVKPDHKALNWKAAIPLLGLAGACLSLYAHAAHGSVNALPAPQSAQESAQPARVRIAPVADFNSCKKPLWPAASLAAGHTGAVTLSFKIDEDGKVTGSRLKKSSGHPLLDEAARTGIALCRFKPGSVDGKPQASWMNMQYVWMLK